jgi:acyl-CoA thioesterase
VASFDEVIRWAPTEQGWAGSLPADWMQGRGAFGGVLAGVVVRALRARVGPDRPLRTLDLTFFAPFRPEPGLVAAQLVRSGRTMTFATARITQRDLPVMGATATFGHLRPSTVRVQSAPPPDLPPPESMPSMPFAPGKRPEFTQHIDHRFAGGRYPFTSQPLPGLEGWCRFRQPASGEEGVVGLLDSWPAPVLSMFTRPAPASSVRWTTHMVGPISHAHEGWWCYRGTAAHAAGGFTTMIGELYGPSGALVAWSEQLVATFDTPTEARRP